MHAFLKVDNTLADFWECEIQVVSNMLLLFLSSLTNSLN